MKNLHFKSILFFSLLFLISCEKQDTPVQDTNTVQVVDFTSVEEIMQLNLDEKFNIPKEVYQNFLDNTIFFDNQLSGLAYGEIDRLLDDTQSEAFWTYFGFSVRNSSATQRDYEIAPLPRPAYMGRKPITGGCEPVPDFVCFGHDNDITNYKPITGGCQAADHFVCFNQ